MGARCTRPGFLKNKLMPEYIAKQPSGPEVAMAVNTVIDAHMAMYLNQGQLATEYRDVVNRTGRMEAVAEIKEVLILEINKLFQA